MNSKKWMLLAVLSFCILALSVKELESNISSFQIIFFRSSIGLILLTFLFRRQLPKITSKILLKHLLRNVTHLLGQYGWIVGILYLSISEVTAIEFTAPIWVIIIAVIFLKEKLTKTKIVSLILGFIGVILILRPGVEIITFNSLIVLASAVSYSITHVLTKTIVKTSSALELVFIMCLIQSPISLALSLPNWEFPVLTDYLWLIVISLSALGAHFSLAKAFQNDEVSNLIVIDYLRLPVLIMAGILFYNEEIAVTLIIGAFLILLGNYMNLKYSK